MDASDRLVLTSDLTELGRVRAFVRERAVAAGFGPPALGEIELAVTEAVSNVIRHAYGGRTTEEVVVEVAVDHAGLLIEIVDRGETPDDMPDADPDFDDPAAGGYGLYLIRTVMDEVQRTREAGGNVLRLRRRRSP